jgi:hypothetical protein
MKPHSLSPTSLARAKWSFSTRRVPKEAVQGLLTDVTGVEAGDLVLARVQRIGSHKRLQTREARHSTLFPDDLVVVACGDRYAVDQFEGRAALAPEGADLLAGGGVIGLVEARNGRIAAPTRLRPLGLLTGTDGRPVNLRDHALRPRRELRPETVIGVVGSGMNAGKTDAAAWLLRGMMRSGARAAGIKATGTGAFGDLLAYLDAGAAEALDFAETGMPSTYRQPLDRVIEGMDTLLHEAAQRRCDVAVVELADGVTQVETAALLAREDVRARFDGFVFAVADPLSALGGLQALAAHGIRPLALAGLATRAPLAVRELEAAGDHWVLDREGLADPASAAALRSLAAAARACAAAPAAA